MAFALGRQALRVLLALESKLDLCLRWTPTPEWSTSRFSCGEFANSLRASSGALLSRVCTRYSTLLNGGQLECTLRSWTEWSRAGGPGRRGWVDSATPANLSANFLHLRQASPSATTCTCVTENALAERRDSARKGPELRLSRADSAVLMCSFKFSGSPFVLSLPRRPFLQLPAVFRATWARARV